MDPGRARSPTSRLGMPKSPEKSGNRTASGSTRGGPRRTARPRPPASAWTQTARISRRTRLRPRHSEARTAPRAKAVRQTDRIGQEEAERNQCEDRERAPQQRATRGEGHRFRALPDQEEPMAGERRERRVLRWCAQEDRGNEVEHRVAPGCCEKKTGEEEAHRLWLRGNVGDQGRKEACEGGLRREDQGRHVVHVKPGRKPR